MTPSDPRIDSLVAWKAEIVGPDSRNGRLGRLESDVKRLNRLMKAAIGFLSAVIIAVAGGSWAAVKAMEDRAEQRGRQAEWERQLEWKVDFVFGVVTGAGFIAPATPAGSDTP